MTCTTPLPERLDPPDTASECAICHRVTEDGRDLDLCDEAVDTLRNAALVRLSARIPTGKQFVCETCLDDLHDAQERHRAEAFDSIMVGTEDCPRGLHACGKGCSIWRLDAPRINALRAQATTTEKETPC